MASQCETSFKLWKKLEETFQRVCIINAILIRKKLNQTNASQSNNAVLQSDLSDKIATAERPLKDEEKAFEILCGLPEEYDPLIMGLVRSKLLTFSLLT